MRDKKQSFGLCVSVRASFSVLRIWFNLCFRQFMSICDIFIIDNGFFLLGFHVDTRDISNYVTWMEDHPSFIEQAISHDVLISSDE